MIALFLRPFKCTPTGGATLDLIKKDISYLGTTDERKNASLPPVQPCILFSWIRARFSKEERPNHMVGLSTYMDKENGAPASLGQGEKSWVWGVLNSTANTVLVLHEHSQGKAVVEQWKMLIYALRLHHMRMDWTWSSHGAPHAEMISLWILWA